MAKIREEIPPGSGMLPHPRAQSPAALGHVDAQLFFFCKIIPGPAAFAQQEIKDFSQHGIPSLFFIIHPMWFSLHDTGVKKV